YQKLIRCLACVVAVDLAVAVVIIDYRSEKAGATSVVAGARPGAGSTNPGPAQPGGILGAGNFANRRGSDGTAATTTTGPAGTALGAPANGEGSDPGATAGNPSGGTGGSPTTSGGSAPNTTRTTKPAKVSPTSPAGTDPVAPTGDTGPLDGNVGVTSTPDPGVSVPQTTATTRPAPATTTTTAKKPPASGSPNVVLADKTGDTVVDGLGTTISSGRADITKTMVEWTAKAVVLTAQVAQTVDPRQDPNWKSDSTYVDWMLDTNGDGTADYEVQYFFDGTNMVADVTKAGDQNSVCGSEASYTADGYTSAIDPACLGGASTFTYTVSMYYDTDPANPNGDVASDTAPDSGQSPVVAKPH
ncbi:MAG TPA: hypothetical protein VHL53_00285, partial [Acidimicrobiia bacterium]|nr:hypothetical protein [Acidimicrobiia bacterium]